MNTLKNLLLVAVSGFAMLTLSSCVMTGGGKGCCAKQSCCHGGKEACTHKRGVSCCDSCGHCAR